MTVPQQTARQQHSGNGVTTVFSTGFQFKANAHVRVIHTDDDDVNTEWVENTHYTLTGADTRNLCFRHVDLRPEVRGVDDLEQPSTWGRSCLGCTTLLQRSSCG